MPYTVLLHDTRTHSSRLFRGWSSRVEVNAFTSLDYAYHCLRAIFRRHGRLEELSILCHGLESYATMRQRTCSGDRLAGGFGLQLCRDNLTSVNVHTTRRLAGIADKIVIYACGAANTEPNHVGHAGDGQRLMGEIALFAQTPVYASDDSTFNPPVHYRHMQPVTWTEDIYRFTPDGSPPEMVQRFPRPAMSGGHLEPIMSTSYSPS